MSAIEFAEGAVYAESVVEQDGVTYFLCKQASSGSKFLGVLGPAAGFVGREAAAGVLLCQRSAENAATLRGVLPWLNPVTLGRQTSFGFGDRLGSATPGHVQALRSVASGERIAPIFAQQSVRENARTGRTPQQVLDDAMWGVFQVGWRAPWGADADHVKEVSDLAPFVAAGYTMYTIDPSDYVDNTAASDAPDVLRTKVAQMAQDDLGATYETLQQRYCAAPFVLAGLTIEFTEVELLRALAKYGRAIGHTVAIAMALAAMQLDKPYEVEMSVDETDTPTSAGEHFFIANELRWRGVPVVSLAPRFVGKFQKGVEYMGDINLFDAELARHVSIMNYFDYYKLSIHTGSDKFAIYPGIARATQRRVHVKTAGTSYLEALRLVAAGDPGLFRAMLKTAREHFEHDRKTYFLDAQLALVPPPATVNDGELPGLLDQFDTRQVLHVTFGTILDLHGVALAQFLSEHEADYYGGLQRHFARHLRPFATPA